MDPKGQRVKLNDSHFIPVLGFGTAVPPEVYKIEVLRPLLHCAQVTKVMLPLRVLFRC